MTNLVKVGFLTLGCGWLLWSFAGCGSLPTLEGPGIFQKQKKYKPKNLREPEYDVFDRSPDRLMMEDLAPRQLGATVRARLTSHENRPKAEEHFSRGQELYDQATAAHQTAPDAGSTRKLFDQAAREFSMAAAEWPDSALEQDALFLQGECQFFANRYVLANRSYEQLIARYTGTKHLDLVESRRFAIAQYWLKLDREHASFLPNVKWGDSKRPFGDLAGRARRILHRIRLDDPTGKLADDATLALANAYFEAERYADAADTYEDLRRTYPGSQHQFHAHLFELKARMHSYQGSSYAGKPVKTADELLRSIVRQFPDQAEEHREYLTREAGRIQGLLAERDYSMAEYYEGRGENRAANYYYAKVADEFDGSQLASEATEKTGELAGLPPTPPQRVTWLANLFPEPKATKPLIAPGDNESILR